MSNLVYNPHLIVDDAAPRPVEVLTLKRPNLLDTVFLNKITKKPCFVTMTTGPSTYLYSVTDEGALREAATIIWALESATDSKKHEIVVLTDGETFNAEQFGRKTNGHSHDRSVHHLQINGFTCQWKTKAQATADPWRAQISDIYHWECTMENPHSPPPDVAESSTAKASKKMKSFFKPSSKSTAPKILLAAYQPPIAYATRTSTGLSIYIDGVPYAKLLLLSSLLIQSRKDDWKTMQSKTTIEQMEARLESDMAGELPRYASRASFHSTVHPTTQWRWNPRVRDHERNMSTPAPLYEYT